jgi:glycosyltransferase involved in cell wall biosynthesis
VTGLIYANTLFKVKLRKMLAGDYDIIHIVNEEMGYVARMAKRSGTKAKVITSVFSLMRLGKGYNKGLMQKAYSNMVAKGLQDAIEYSDLMIFSGTELQEQAQERFGRIRKVRQIYIGPPHDSFVKAAAPKKRKGKVITVGYVGALALRKNPLFILKTAELMKDKSWYRFIVYGSGAEYNVLERYKKERGLHNVTLMGFAPEERLMEIYDSFDIFFYPSIEEGSSLPVFDAFARRLPVVLYRKTNMSQEVKKYGIIADDEKDAARIIENIGAHGYSNAKRSAAYRYVRSYSWDRVFREVFGAYKEVLAGKI